MIASTAYIATGRSVPTQRLVSSPTRACSATNIAIEKKIVAGTMVTSLVYGKLIAAFAPIIAAATKNRRSPYVSSFLIHAALLCTTYHTITRVVSVDEMTLRYIAGGGLHINTFRTNT